MDAAFPLDRAHRDDARLTELLARERPRLTAFVRRRVAELADVEDIVQDTLAELVAAERLLEPIGQVAGWLLRVARNRIVDRYRARARELPALPAEPAASGEEAAAPLERVAASDGDPEAAYGREALGTELLAALAALPAAQREVFIAHEFEGISFRALAAASGVPVSTLLGRKHAAVRALRHRLRDLHADLDH
jgi:RNA polymerase sigma factor (sigma-70 family)